MKWNFVKSPDANTGIVEIKHNIRNYLPEDNTTQQTLCRHCTIWDSFGVIVMILQWTETVTFDKATADARDSVVYNQRIFAS